MRIEINLLARRPVKIMHIFEIADVFLIIVFGFLMPFVAMIFFNINFLWTLAVGTIPVMVFVFKFRVRRRSGYFLHYMDFQLRPRRFVFGWASRDRADGFLHRCLGYEYLPRYGKK